MRRHTILLSIASILFSSCLLEEFEFLGDNHQSLSSADGIHVIGTAQEFDAKKVTTRADGDDMPADSYISEMTMFIFDKNGKLLQGYTDRTITSLDDDGLPSGLTFDESDKCTSAINIKKANPTFLIDTKNGMIANMDDQSPDVIYYDNLTNNDNDLSSCTIYIVANAWHELEGNIDDIEKLSDLEDIVLEIDGTLSMPKADENHYRGFPMIGTHADQTFDLNKAGSNQGAVAKIPLKKLYSKVEFTIQVNADQVVSTPKFKIDKVEVFNVPNRARLGRAVVDGKPSYTDSDDYIVEMSKLDVNNSDNPYDYYQFTENPFVIEDGFSRTEIQHTSSKKLNPGSEYLIEFGFYMPEHKLTPNKNRDTYDYPDDIPEDLKQYYKPKLVGTTRNEDGTTNHDQLATFVRIHGEYTDHNGQIKKVRYDVYLGQNNTDDFTVKRNQLLTNKLVISGLTNYHDAYGGVEENISIDHRVDVEYKGFSLSMERTAILDSHFEVRPLDIELSPGSSMKITIPEAYRSWIAMEDDAKAEGGDHNVYANTTDARKGVRKYFTTDLVSDLNDPKDGNGGTITIVHNGEGLKVFRIWFYIDENLNVYDKLLDAASGIADSSDDESGENDDNQKYRNCPVEFKYTGTDNDNTDGVATISKTAIVNFQQWNLWRVWSVDGNRSYDIEHEEEYLNNYASDAQYGQTQDGIPWGLYEKQLSYIHDSFTCNEDNSDWKSFIEKNPIKYDFYIGQHDDDNEDSDLQTKDGGTLHNFAGQEFTKEIAENPNAGEDVHYLTLGQQARSAVQYCYSRNKRNPDGTVDVKWYLPSADELEDFIVAAYSDFKEFQDNYYWTSQPAYIRNAFYYEYYNGSQNDRNREDTYVFIVYEDNKTHARATKVAYINGKYDYVPSSLNITSENATIDCNSPICKDTYFNVMYGWYRWTDSEWSWSDFQYHTVTRTLEKIGNNAMTADEHYNEYIDGIKTGNRYHVELGHLEDLIQKTEGGEHGYHERTEMNRVRCVRVKPTE